MLYFIILTFWIFKQVNIWTYKNVHVYMCKQHEQILACLDFKLVLVHKTEWSDINRYIFVRDMKYAVT